jgi:hypothetical protein
MPDSTSEAAEKLRKLGQRLREGIAIKRPISERSLATVREAVREQWQLEQIAKRKQPVKSNGPKPPSRRRLGPEPER